VNIGLSVALVTALGVSLTMIVVALWFIVSARRNRKGEK
jgi:hypothetical protein